MPALFFVRVRYPAVDDRLDDSVFQLHSTVQVTVHAAPFGYLRQGRWRKTKEAGGGKSSESERGRSQKSRHKGKNEPHSTAMYSLCNVAGRTRYINTVWIKSATPGCVKFYWYNTEGNSKCPQWIQSTATVDDGKVDTALFECQVFAVSEMRPVEIISKLLPPLLWPTNCKVELKTKEKEVNNRWACGDVTVFRIDQSNVK